METDNCTSTTNANTITNCYWLNYCVERLPCGICKITGHECYKKYQSYWPYTYQDLDWTKVTCQVNSPSITASTSS